MFFPTVVLGCLATILLGIGYFNGQGQHVSGLKLAYGMTLNIVPLLVFALIVAGMLQVLIPKEDIARWVGAESGVRGILIGSVAGSLVPGGPMIGLPIVAGLFKAGAGVGTLVSFMAAWSLISVSRILLEIGFLGLRFTMIRLACTFFFPPLAGILAQTFFAK